MSVYSDADMEHRKQHLIESARSQVESWTVNQLCKYLLSNNDLVVLDVRERHEFEKGRIPNAIHVPRGLLELEIENYVSPQQSIVVYCASGVRSLLASVTLLSMGYKYIFSLEGGFNAWRNEGQEIEDSSDSKVSTQVTTGPENNEYNRQKVDVLSTAQLTRYQRQIALPELGVQGQRRLLESRVLLIGAGGLGSPIALYLAAAGVGTIGLVDDDFVEVSNLQRQILHGYKDVGHRKVESGFRRIQSLDSDINVVTFPERLTANNISKVLSHDWDVVVDGTDMISVRYLINDECRRLRLPWVYAAIYRFEGQVSVFGAQGPCYRCLFPEPPPPELTPSCAEAGVLGVLPGIIGTLQAMETLKILLSLGEGLSGRLLRYDAKLCKFDTISFSQDPSCQICSHR